VVVVETKVAVRIEVDFEHIREVVRLKGVAGYFALVDSERYSGGLDSAGLGVGKSLVDVEHHMDFAGLELGMGSVDTDFPGIEGLEVAGKDFAD